MSTKKQALAEPSSVLNKTADDEPIFVLRANDPCATEAISFWLSLAAVTHEPEKCKQAYEVLDQFRHWRRKNKQS